MSIPMRASGAARYPKLLDAVLGTSFVGVLLWALAERITYIDQTFGKSIGCDGCLTASVLIHDLAYLACTLALVVLSFRVRRFALHVPLRAAGVLGILVYVADVVIMDAFYTRLMLGDVVVYGDQVPLIVRHVQSTGLLGWPLWSVGLAGIWLTVFIAFPPSGLITKRLAAALLALSAAAIIGGYLAAPASYVHDWALRNVVAANFSNGVTKRYSDEYVKQLLERADHGQTGECRDSRGRSPDIVLLILESWSPYQSRLFSGINDWTPRLDALARENSWYTRMHASGFTTNEGLISLLTGLEYISPQKSFFALRPFETAWETPQTLPGVLEETQGYFSAFLTSGNLGFSSKGKWLESLGFDYIEGHGHPGYDGIERRLHFQSVPDRILYDRSLEYIAGLRERRRPFFVAIESVSTHHPYIQPETRERSQETAFRYMDRTAADFHSGLADSGFFDNGLLIIISDHRAMIPVTREEQDRFGRASASLIPAIAIGPAAPKGRIDVPFQQSDLVSTLAALTSKEYCHSGPYRDILRPRQTEPRCIFHARGDNRDHLDVFCPEGNHIVQLDGDATRIVGSDIDKQRADQIVQRVNLHRIRADRRQRRLEDSGYFDKKGSD